MQRIWEDLELPIAKRTRSQNRSLVNISTDKPEWISATEFDNFCLKDPIIDWFNQLKCVTNYPERYTEKNNPLSFLFERGRLYEDSVIQKLREKTGLSLEKQSSLSTSRLYTDLDDRKDLYRTIEKMKMGYYLIYSAYLSDRKEKIRGIPDLLIRNDYIPLLFPDIKNIPEGKSIFGNYYYIPVEIKFSTMSLAADGIHILNEGRNSFYKTQLYTYCKILSHLQQFQPSISLIIGKRTVKKGVTNNSLSLPAKIDFENYDSHIPELFTKGLKWLRDVKQYGLGWKPYDRSELIPNMKIYNETYQREKQYLASIHGEITELWQCGIKNREIAFSKGIFSRNDPRLSSEIMNVGSSYSNVVDRMIQINRGELGDYYPPVLEKNINNFQSEGNEMFVDFELVRDSFDISSFGMDEWIFLIGVYYKGRYHSFRIYRENSEDEISLQKERENINNFINFWEESGRPKCWYWYAEKEFWRRALLRHPSIERNIKWVDLYQVIKEEPFVLKGAMNFKLKTYVKCLMNMGKIKINLPSSNCSSGLDALFIAYDYYYNDYIERDEREKRMIDIIDYNRFDCESLYQIITFMRGLKA
jgi:hypothetical protein